jgi:type III restriction enzyme
VVRYQLTPESLIPINTGARQRSSIGVASLRRGEAAIFADEFSFQLSDEETRTLLAEVRDDESLPRMAWQEVRNAFHFKTPLNIVLTNHKPEYDFVKHLIKPENAQAIDAWLKSTDRDFYAIEYAWRKGEHPTPGFFSPDFFIKQGHHILVIEIKGDEEISDPSRENKGKYKYAQQHFTLLNQQQTEYHYLFHFLTPMDYDKFFKFLRDGNPEAFVNSILDTALEENGS